MYRNHYLSSLKNEIFEICITDSKPVTLEGHILRIFLLILHVSLGVEHRYGIWNMERKGTTSLSFKNLPLVTLCVTNRAII